MAVVTWGGAIRAGCVPSRHAPRTRRTAAGASGGPSRGRFNGLIPRSAAIRREPKSTAGVCACQVARIGEDVAGTPDAILDRFLVARHIGAKSACARCDALNRARHRVVRASAGGHEPGAAAMPSGRHLRSGGAGDSPVDPGPTGGPDGRAAASAGGAAPLPDRRARALCAFEGDVLTRQSTWPRGRVGALLLRRRRDSV